MEIKNIPEEGGEGSKWDFKSVFHLYTKSLATLADTVWDPILSSFPVVVPVGCAWQRTVTGVFSKHGNMYSFTRAGKLDSYLITLATVTLNFKIIHINLSRVYPWVSWLVLLGIGFPYSRGGGRIGFLTSFNDLLGKYHLQILYCLWNHSIESRI